MKTVRIGNAAGFWGDHLDAPRRLAETGQLDYLTLEYLAELTMSILAHLKTRDPQAGFVSDLPATFQSLAESLRSQPHLKVVTNGGGMNPAAAATAAARVLAAENLADVRVAAVSGDDLLPQLDALLADGEEFRHFETGQALGDLREKVVCANAYLGAAGIAGALEQGARIVITGRVADASLTVGPCVHEFGWAWDDWQSLAAATVAGHLIECGAQASGGMFSDWSPELDLSDVGYPIAEVGESGRVVITKPTGTGGRVTVETVAEQLIYEIGDPRHYLTPDVDADFSGVTLSSDGVDRVAVANASGDPRPERLKVSLAYADGFTVSGMLVVCGPRAVEKAQECGRIILDKVRRAGYSLKRTNIECLGAGDCVPGILKRAEDPPEVVLRVTAFDPSREALERLSREFAPLVTAGPPGVTGYTGGRSKPRPVLAYWPTTVDRNRVQPHVECRRARDWLSE